MRLAVALAMLLVAFPMPAAGMDAARRLSRTDDAVAEHGVTGAGVTVVIMDRGIDWRHPDFIRRSATGTPRTRIKALLDMSGQQGCPGNPPPVAYTEAQINAALAGGPALATRDAVGHGTVTAGIAAGNGRALSSRKYRGIAPEADLVIVKLVGDGVPGEPFFFGCIPEALDWVNAKIAELGQPAVAIMNIGVQYGPMDGTGATSRKVDEIFGARRSGRVYVAPAGDEGGLPNHAGGTYTSAGATVVKFRKTEPTDVTTLVWYSGARPAAVTVAFADGTSVGPSLPGTSIEAGDVRVYHYLPGADFFGSTGGDRLVAIVHRGHTGLGSIRIRGLGAGSGRFDAYGDLHGSEFLTSNVRFLDHLARGRLADLATTRSAVVAPVYVARHAWTDLDGIPRDLSTEGTTGALWFKSSGGPTRDGRRGVTVTAPGHNVFAPLSAGSFWATGRANQVQDGLGRYVRGGGASGSGPLVVGAVALMLQLRPDLTADQVRDVLEKSAASDAVTGPVPNRDWGAGRLDVRRALDMLAAERSELVVTAVADPPATRRRGAQLTVTDTVDNVAWAAAGAFRVGYFLVPAVAPAGDRPRLGRRTIGGLAFGERSRARHVATIPGTVAPGSYFVRVCADVAREVSEEDEGNNCRSSASSITITP